MGLMAMAAFLTMISPGPAVGIGAGPTSRGVLAALSQAARFDGVDILVDWEGLRLMRVGC